MEENVKWGTKDLKKGYRFSARIDECKWIQNDYGKKQLNITLVLTEPTDKAGEVRTIYLPYSDSINSKWGMFQSQLETLPLPVDITKLDNPEKWLIGKVFVWEQRKQMFKDKETSITIPIKYIGEAEKEEQKEEPAKQPVNSVDNEKQILDILKTGDKTVDDLMTITSMPPDVILNILEKLETERKVIIKRGGIIHATEV